MKKFVSKFLKITSIGFAIGFMYLGLTTNTIATALPDSKYFWNQEKTYKSQEYEKYLRMIRNEELKKILDVDDNSVYLEDMNSLYDLSFEKDKIKEVEDIMTDYEKKYIFYEIVLLTGDELLAKKYYDDEELYFSFERVI